MATISLLTTDKRTLEAKSINRIDRRFHLFAPGAAKGETRALFCARFKMAAHNPLHVNRQQVYMVSESWYDGIL
jgi:hypothetical protein